MSEAHLVCLECLCQQSHIALPGNETITTGAGSLEIPDCHGNVDKLEQVILREQLEAGHVALKIRLRPLINS